MTGTRWRPIVVMAALAPLMLASACGSGAAPAATGPSTSAHTSHGTFVPPTPAPLRPGERFVNLTMAEPYAPSAPGGGTDEYRCFLVDPKVTGSAYLTGSQFLPQNVDIVHHAIFFRVSAADAAKARQLDDEVPGPGWQCFGDSGIDGDDAWVAHWAPGANETLLRQGLGYAMPSGSVLIMQVHYNLLATGGKSGGTDQSSIRLRLADGRTPMTELGTFELPGPIELPCTAEESGPLCVRDAAVADVTRRFGDDVGSAARGLNELCNQGRPPVPGPTQHCDHTVDGDGTIYAVAGHMHLLGRSIKVELNPGTPRAQTLLDIPVYNFDDQAIRPLAQPVKIKKGDVARVTCTHDAGLRKRLPQLQTLPPRYVVWGDGTSDEMCLGLLVGAQS